MATVDNLDIQISASISQSTAALRQLSGQLDSVGARLRSIGALTRSAGISAGSGFSSVTAEIKKLNSSAANVSAGMKKLAGGFSKAAESTRGMSDGLKDAAKRIITLGAAFKGLKTAISESVGYIETLNYFERAFGQVAEKADLSSFSELGYKSAEAYAESFAERAKELTGKMTGFDINADGTLAASGRASLGLDPERLMNYQAMYAQMASSMGAASETSLKLSNALTMIGADLASVKNMPFEKVWQDMASGMAGMSRTLDKYGANIRNVNLQQKLNGLGIKANISSLNQNDKALLRTIILLDSAKYAWGDLAATLNRPANQFRLLAANMQNLARTIGNLFLPVIAKALPYINGLVIALQRLFAWIGKALKIDISGLLLKDGGSNDGIGDLLDGTEQLKDNADDAAKSMKKLNRQTRQFDELKAISTPSGADGGSGAGAGGFGGLLNDAFDKAFEEYRDAWGKAFKGLENNANSTADKIQGFFTDIWQPIGEAWNSQGKFAMDSWKYALGEVKKLIGDIGRDLMAVWQQPETAGIFDGIFKIAGDIGLVAGNIAQKFREAWNTNEAGLRIFGNIRDILGVIVGSIRLAADYTVEWSEKLDFYPLLSKVEEWTRSLTPVVDALSGAASDFYTAVLLPLAQWTLEKGIPDLLQVFIDFNSKVDWAALRENLKGFWTHLEPFAETVGEGLILFIRDVSDALANFLNSEDFKSFLKSTADWMDKVTPRDVADGIAGIAKAIVELKLAMIGLTGLTVLADIIITFQVLAKAMKGVKAAIAGSKIAEALALWTGGAGTLAESLQAVFTPLQGVIAAAAGAFMAVSNFVTMLKEGFSWLNEILMVVGIGLTAVGAVILGAPALVAAAVAGIVAAVATIAVVVHDNWDAICGWLSGAADWINTNVIQPAIGFFKGVWTSVSGFFTNLWNDIVKIWGMASGWFNNTVITPAVNFFAGFAARVGQIFEGLWIIIQAVWITVSDWFDKNVITPIAAMFADLWDGIAAVWSLVSGWFNDNIIVPVTGFFSQLWTDVSGFFSNLWEDIKDVWQSVSGWFSDNITDPVESAFDAACEAIGGFFDGLWLGIKSGVVGAMNAVIGGIETAINWIVDGINGILGGFNKVVSWAAKVAEVDWGGVDLVARVSLGRIPALAKGEVFPGGSPYLAVVNDQPAGQTNIEALLQTIKQALREELLNFRVAVPDMKALSYSLEPAPAPDFDSMYRSYRNDASSSFRQSNARGSEMADSIENAVYKATYNAVSSAIRNSKLLNDMLDEVKKGHTVTMDGTAIYRKMVERASEDMRTNRGQRLVVSSELY